MEILSEERPVCFSIDPLQPAAELGESPRTSIYISGGNVKYRQHFVSRHAAFELHYVEAPIRGFFI